MGKLRRGERATPDSTCRRSCPAAALKRGYSAAAGVIDLMPGMTQRCQTCGRVLANTEFPPVEGKQDERAAQCYQCRNKSWADLSQASATRAHLAREAARSQEIARAQETSARIQEANARTQEIRTPEVPKASPQPQRVVITGIDIPFGDVLGIVFTWSVAIVIVNLALVIGIVVILGVCGVAITGD